MPPKIYRKQYYFDTEVFIDIVHDIERIPSRPPPKDDVLAQNVPTDQLHRWQEVFGLNASDARLIIADTQAGAFDRRKISEEMIDKWPWTECERLGFDKEAYRF
jgi:hypothetical protein